MSTTTPNGEYTISRTTDGYKYMRNGAECKTPFGTCEDLAKHIVDLEHTLHEEAGRIGDMMVITRGPPKRWWQHDFDPKFNFDSSVPDAEQKEFETSYSEVYGLYRNGEF